MHAPVVPFIQVQRAERGLRCEEHRPSARQLEKLGQPGVATRLFQRSRIGAAAVLDQGIAYGMVGNRRGV